MNKTPQQLADEHADYVCELVRKIYVDAFIHGYKHGVVIMENKDK